MTNLWNIYLLFFYYKNNFKYKNLFINVLIFNIIKIKLFLIKL